MDKKWYEFEDLYPAAVKAGTYQGKLLVIPVGTEAEIMVFRKDLLAQKGLAVPENISGAI